MIKILLIEDEFHVREGIKKMLELINIDYRIVGETEYVSEAVSLIESTCPDIILIDIMLRDGTGFDILDHKIHEESHIIFVTSYKEYAIQAFKYSTVDYLLKPISPVDLKLAVERASQKVYELRKYQELLAVLKNNITNKEQVIVLNTSSERHMVKINDIIRLEADGAYTKFICTSKKIIVSRNIKYYQSVLNDQFIRCHQSHMININKVTNLSKMMLKLSNGDKVPVSIRRKADVIKILNSSF